MAMNNAFLSMLPYGRIGGTPSLTSKRKKEHGNTEF